MCENFTCPEIRGVGYCNKLKLLNLKLRKSRNLKFNDEVGLFKRVYQYFTERSKFKNVIPSTENKTKKNIRVL